MWFLSLFGYLLLFTASSQDTNHLELFWNLYSSVVRGSRILHDVTEGVGAVSKAIKAIDLFLDAPVEDIPPAPELEPEGAGVNSRAVSIDTVSSTPNSPPLFTPQDQLPAFSGCGALGFHIRDENLPLQSLTECCGVHDSCYLSSCKANKRDCDSKLRSCLFSICEVNSLLLDKNMQRNCRGAAKLLFSGTMALSFKQYSDAQTSLSCKVGKPNKWKK